MKTKMKQLFGILLTLALVLGLIPGMSLTAYAEDSTWTTNSLPSNSGNYKLGNDINVGNSHSESIVVLGSNQNISIDLAGHTITMAEDSSSNHTFYQIKNGATLTIKDSVGGGRITRLGNWSDDSVIWVDGGTLNWEGGTVSGVHTKCGVIDVGNGQFNMTGGSFTGNYLSDGGQGAVRLLSGTSFLRISGKPVITGNTGGNVYVSNGSKIEIIGALNSGANISVNMQTPGVFTSEYGSHYNTDSSASDPWNFFQSDDSENKWVLWNDDFTEAMLGDKSENSERKSVVPSYTINYEDETATPQSGYEISTNGTTTEDSPVNLTPILNESENPVIYVRKKAEGSQEAGQWEKVTLSSRPNAPTGIHSTNATNDTSADGTITGVNTTMEYSADGTNWTAVSDTTITGLTPGTYYVRIKATETAPHGIPTEVKVGSREIILDPENTMTMPVEVDNTLKRNSARGLPEEINDLEVTLTISIKSGDTESTTVKPLTLTLKKGETSLTQDVDFDQLIEGLGPGKQSVTVSVSPRTVYGRDKIYSSDGPVEGPVKWKYELSGTGEINEKDGKMIVRVYLYWDDGKHAEPEVIKVYALPEDEIGAYKLKADGTKEYLLFHTYDICMQWLGRDELCRGYERCFHKESPFVNPFVKP